MESGNNTCSDEKNPSLSTFGANGGTRVFRIGLGGGVDVKLFGITLAGADISFMGEANLGGRITVKAKFTVKILFVRKSVTITIADFWLPVQLINGDAPPPHLATLQSGGVLRLNVGTFADQRGVSQTETVEEYVIRREGTVIVVSAFGYEERFSGVTSIVGDFGSGNDAFIAFNELNVPATIHGGIGNDFLAFSSTTASCATTGNQATLYGDDGNDDLRGGSCGDLLDGGVGNDYLDGGAGVDTMIGADGDDVFFGYINEVMNETTAAGAGTDTFELIGTPGADTMTVGVHNSAVRIGYGSGNLDLTQFENLVLRTQGGDTLTMSGALNTVGIQNVSIGFGMTHLAPNEATVCDATEAAMSPKHGGLHRHRHGPRRRGHGHGEPPRHRRHPDRHRKPGGTAGGPVARLRRAGGRERRGGPERPHAQRLHHDHGLAGQLHPHAQRLQPRHRRTRPAQRQHPRR